METRAVRNLRLKWTSYIKWYGPDDSRTVKAARELAEARADVAEAEARRLREAANAMAAGVELAS